MVVVTLATDEWVETTIANIGFMSMFGSVTDEAGHVLNPGIMLFAGVLLIFQE